MFYDFFKEFEKLNKKNKNIIYNIILMHSSFYKYSEFITKKEFSYLIEYSLSKYKVPLFQNLFLSNLIFYSKNRTTFIENMSSNLIYEINKKFKINKYIMNGYCYWNIDLSIRSIYRDNVMNKGILFGASCEGHANHYNKNCKILPQYIGFWKEKGLNIYSSCDINKFTNYKESKYEYVVLSNRSKSNLIDLKLLK